MPQSPDIGLNLDAQRQAPEPLATKQGNKAIAAVNGQTRFPRIPG
jgi:hypothetical protein